MRFLTIFILVFASFETFGQSPGNVSGNLKLWLKASDASASVTNLPAWNIKVAAITTQAK